MNKTEFTIKKREDLKFRTAFKSGTEILAFQLVMNFTDVDKTVECMNWLLERIEVYIAEQWIPVKEQKYDVFNPAYLSEDLVAQQQLIFYMMNYIKEVFQQSNESSQKQQ